MMAADIVKYTLKSTGIDDIGRYDVQQLNKTT